MCPWLIAKVCEFGRRKFTTAEFNVLMILLFHTPAIIDIERDLKRSKVEKEKYLKFLLASMRQSEELSNKKMVEKSGVPERTVKKIKVRFRALKLLDNNCAGWRLAVGVKSGGRPGKTYERILMGVFNIPLLDYLKSDYEIPKKKPRGKSAEVQEIDF